MALVHEWWRSEKAAVSPRMVRVKGAELRVAWVDFVGCVPWQLFVTLTVDPKRDHSIGCSRIEKEALRWCGLVGWVYRTPAAWLIAPERGKTGQWHAHVLFVGVPVDITLLISLWQVRNGRVDVRSVSDPLGAVLYATKDAALSGEVLLADTLLRYRNQLIRAPRVELYR